MNTWLRILLSLSLSGALLTLVLMALSRPLGRRLGRRWQYYIWLIAVLRLLLPIPAPAGLPAPALPASGYSSRQPGADSGEQYTQLDGAGELTAGKNDGEGLPAHTVNSFWTVPGGESGDSQPLESSGAAGSPARTAQADELGPSNQLPAMAGTGRTSQPPAAARSEGGLIPAQTAAALGTLAFAVWLAVAGALLGKKMWSYRRALKLLCTTGESTAEFDRVLERACRDCGLSRRPRVLVIPGVSSPAAVGLFRPVIAVPADLSPDQAYYVFLHEAIHIRRQDALYKWAVEIAACVHWFNPAVPVLRRETARACELSCDEAVVRLLDGEKKRIYGTILLDTLGRHVRQAGAEMSLPLSENGKWMKERLGAIMGYKTRSRGSAFAAAALSVSLIAAALLCGFAPPRAGEMPADVADAADTSAGEGDEKRGQKASEKMSGERTAENPDEENTVIDESEIKRRSDQKSLQEKLVWKNKYIVALAWNVDSSQYGVKREILGKTVCFGKKAVQYADDGAVEEAVRQVIERETGKENGYPPEELVLLMVDGPFEGTADELSLQFYQENNLLYFTTVIDEAGEDTCISILEQSYTEDRLEYFSMACDRQGEALVNKRKELARRSAREGKIEYFSMLSSRMDGEEMGAFALDAYEAGQLELLYICAPGMNSDQAAVIAEKAYEDDRVEYLYPVLPQLTDAQRRELRERAKKDGKAEYGYLFW